jgi:hypothetical protein
VSGWVIAGFVPPISRGGQEEDGSFFVAELLAKPISTTTLPLLACALQGMLLRIKGREFSGIAMI